jgi:cyclin-dependent kinase 12/13
MARRHIDEYRKIRQIGEGTYGRVYLCEDKETMLQVAIKKVLIDTGKEGFPQTAVREVKLLATLRHENVVRLLDIVTPPPHSIAETATIFMVFEYLDHDLAGLLRDNRVEMTPYLVKWLMKQLVEGLQHCHQHRVLHRDIKASNVLIDNYGNLKLADFGLARSYSETCSDTKYSNKVITLWYRPPELLLGSETYGPAVDMWSVGCILAEMIEGRPLFQGQNHIDQLEVIFTLCGTPTHENWPSHTELPWFEMFKPPHMIDRCLRQHLSINTTVECK